MNPYQSRFGLGTPASANRNQFAGGVPNSVYAANYQSNSQPGAGMMGSRPAQPSGSGNAPQISTRGGGGSPANIKLGSVPKPNFQTPQSSIPVNQLNAAYRPYDVMQRNLNNQVASLHQQADPFLAFQSAGASADNMSSASGNSKVAHIQQSMAQPLQQAAMLQAAVPLEHDIDKYNFNTGLLGMQSQGILQREGIMDQNYGNKLSDYLSGLGQKLSLAQLLMG